MRVGNKLLKKIKSEFYIFLYLIAAAKFILLIGMLGSMVCFYLYYRTVQNPNLSIERANTEEITVTNTFYRGSREDLFIETNQNKTIYIIWSAILPALNSEKFFQAVNTGQPLIFVSKKADKPLINVYSKEYPYADVLEIKGGILNFEDVKRLELENAIGLKNLGWGSIILQILLLMILRAWLWLLQHRPKRHRTRDSKI